MTSFDDSPQQFPQMFNTPVGMDDPHVDATALARAAEQTDDLKLRCAALRHRNCPPALVLEAATSEIVEERIAAARNTAPNLERELLSATDTTLKVRVAYATERRFHNTAERIIRLLVEDQSVQVHRMAAHIPNLFDALQDTDLTAGTFKKALLVADRSDVPVRHRLLLAQDPDVIIRVANARQIATALYRPFVTLLTVLLNDPSEDVRAASIHRRNHLNFNEAFHAAQDPSATVRTAVASSNLTEIDAIRDLLLTDTNPTVLSALIAARVTLTDSDVERLSCHPDAQVRAATAQYATLDTNTLNALIDDPDETVRAAATERFLLALSSPAPRQHKGPYSATDITAEQAGSAYMARHGAWTP